MTLRVILAALVAVAAPVALHSAPADSAYKLKPGARGKACLACHSDFTQVLAKTSVHAPVRAGECTDCHDPHTSSHGKLLAAEAGALCATCHGALVPEAAASAHEMVAAGECAACHDPHASEHPHLLRGKGNEACLSCHGELAAAIAAAKFPHSPVVKSCTTCHDPHASATNPSLLVKDEGSLCSSCHAPGEASFARAHRGYPVGRARCTSCHDPHGSSTRGALWATVHPPVASGACGQCHAAADAPDPLTTKHAGAETCRPCHGEIIDRTFTARRTHWPVLDAGGCLNCHEAHASPVAGLLREEPKPLCFSCHADTAARQARTVTAHPPVEEGNCVACHDPHASDATFLLVGAGVTEACAACHDWKAHSSHPIGEDVIDPRNPNLGLDCASCHVAHGAEHEHLAPFDTDAGLCVQCHQRMTR
jgi:DmsE family decaheme c-type cytochrome